MAIESNITAAHRLFKGTDKRIRFHVFGQDGKTPLDVADKAMAFVVSKTDKGAALITKTTDDGIEVDGAFDADPALNEQRVIVTLDDIDTDALKSLVYRYGLKVTDEGEEDVLAFGNFTLLQQPVT